MKSKGEAGEHFQAINDLKQIEDAVREALDKKREAEKPSVISPERIREQNRPTHEPWSGRRKL